MRWDAAEYPCNIYMEVSRLGSCRTTMPSMVNYTQLKKIVSTRRKRCHHSPTERCWNQDQMYISQESQIHGLVLLFLGEMWAQANHLTSLGLILGHAGLMLSDSKDKCPITSNEWLSPCGFLRKFSRAMKIMIWDITIWILGLMNEIGAHSMSKTQKRMLKIRNKN